LIERQDKDDPEAKNRISLAEVRFGQLKPTFGPQANAIQSIQARLYNDSKKFSLTDYSYYLVIQDCVETKSSVRPLRSARPYTISVGVGRPWWFPEPGPGYHDSIPVDSVTFAPTFKILGEPRIELTPTDTRAYRSTEHPQPAEASAAG